MLAAAALLGTKDRPRSVLMLGLPGGTTLRILRRLLPASRFTAVEIDREIVRLARQHMALDATGVEVVIGDAYEWLKANRRTFDVVIDDIYLAGRTDVFRPQAMDRTLLRKLRRCLAPGGVLAVNLVTGPGHRAAQSATRRLLRESFPEVRAVTSPAALNEVLVAGPSVATGRRLRDREAAFTDARDRAHQCRVALALSRAGCDDPTLLAAALLHDTGKSVTGRAPSLADRIAFVMLSKLRPSLVQRMAASGFPAGVASAARHAEVGADRLRQLGADPYLVWLVRHHHRDDIVDDPLLARLRAADRSVP